MNECEAPLLHPTNPLHLLPLSFVIHEYSGTVPTRSA